MGNGLNMGSSWKHVFASEIGVSHHGRGDPCQDYALVREFQIGDQQFLIGACSDGAGSCPQSHIGSSLACETFVSTVETKLEEAITAGIGSEDNYRQWISVVRQRLAEAAESSCLQLREYSCTLLTAVIAEKWAWFSQIGDGVIVIRQGAELRHVFWPQTGEYANTTFFLTGEDFHREVVVLFLEEPINEVAMLSDGLQPLALHYETRSVHSPFFEPMFHTLKNWDQTTDLTTAVKAFLGSDRVNSRTDDDKTLILASRILPTS